MISNPINGEKINYFFNDFLKSFLIKNFQKIRIKFKNLYENVLQSSGKHIFYI